MSQRGDELPQTGLGFPVLPAAAVGAALVAGGVAQHEAGTEPAADG